VLITLIVIRILGCRHLHFVLQLGSGWSSVCRDNWRTGVGVTRLCRGLGGWSVTKTSNTSTAENMTERIVLYRNLGLLPLRPKALKINYKHKIQVTSFYNGKKSSTNYITTKWGIIYIAVYCRKQDCNIPNRR